MKNCSGINCPMQYGVVDAATCPAVDCCPNATPPLTNYDCIISKSPEELAKWIATRSTNPQRIGWSEWVQCWLDWLKQEARE